MQRKPSRKCTRASVNGTPPAFRCIEPFDKGTPPPFLCESPCDKGTPALFLHREPSDNGTPARFLRQRIEEKGTVGAFRPDGVKNKGTAAAFRLGTFRTTAKKSDVPFFSAFLFVISAMISANQIGVWLRDSGDNASADIIDQCSVEVIFIDLLFELSGGERIYNLVDVQIEAPASIFKQIKTTLKANSEAITSAINELVSAQDSHIRGICWVPQLPTAQSLSHHEMTKRLSVVDSHHVAIAWKKAQERTSDDPEGAITAARTLLECVYKHVIEKTSGNCDSDLDLPALHRLAVSKLQFATLRENDDLLKRILGNCQAVVSGIATLRNRLGDAHGKDSKDARPIRLHAELAVNLAGSVSSFLVASLERDVHGSQSQPKGKIVP